MILDELSHHAELAQDLSHGENEIGRGRPLPELACQLEANDLRQEHRDRLPEHRGLGLDAAHAPAEDAEPVHHRRVRIRADERVRKGPELPVVKLARLDDAREVLEVDLVDDAGVRRHDAEILERPLPPTKEGVALAVPLELELGVPEDRPARPVLVDLDGVVDDELDREERIDPLRDRRRGRRIASRIAARSTIAGTPVKSCRRMREGRKEISSLGSAPGSHRRIACASSAAPARSTFSRSTRRVYGRRVTSAPSASRRTIVSSRPPTVSVSWSAIPVLDASRIAGFGAAIVARVTARLEELLRHAFPDARELAVEDRTGGGDHFQVTLASPRFQGLPLVEQHRLVYDALAAPLADGTIHELRIKTRGEV